MGNDYKDTLNLPKTDFPMKGNLTKMEPEIMDFWKEIGLDKKLMEDDGKRERFILHDGPPYANGDIHLGHTLNKVLKDLIVKYARMSGYYAPYVPGWDCHGQPIEHEVEKRLGKEKATISKADLRIKCREYALKFVDRQRDQFKRLGITGDWDEPYLTLNHTYEATNVRMFNDLYQKGLIYKGRKPIHWCWSCRTALSEAEIEYSDETSSSVYVKFPLVSDFDLLEEYDEPKNLLIWTTTPWTLPANVAVAVHPEASYSAILWEGEIIILASALVEDISKMIDKPAKILTTFKGSDLSGQFTKHPIFEDKRSIVLTADYVSLEQGSGCVHIAPGHGAEDYAIGIENDLDAPMPVDDRGVFTDEAGKFSGEHILKANDMIIDDLRERGLLVKMEKIEHSYPHCWRCKKPVIFRATEQWFISMDATDLRKNTLAAIEKVEWTPGWSKNRITAMITDRPDWCISRQRSWGVPIPVFYCEDCDSVLATKKVLEFVENVFLEEGADTWFTKSTVELMPADTKCEKCGGVRFRTENDILDVWFESGVSHEAVLKTRDELSWPADIYLEGSDQHRGWFQSSLLTSVGAENKPPYRGVITHGFLVDSEGRKMSKSLGNVVDPLKVIKGSGADILRLWVTSSDYSSDIAISQEILQRITETYRRMRNTIRFLLGNIADFDPEIDSIDYEDLEDIDKWALQRLNHVIRKTEDAYAEYKFYLAYHSIYNFCNIDLSSFYMDILKDRLYTFSADSKERRSSQTVMAKTLVSLVKLLAPILSFTAEEAWTYLPPFYKDAESVHLSSMPKIDDAHDDLKLEQDWERLIQLRGEVSKALELARKEKIVNSSLEARVTIYPPQALRELIGDYDKELKTIFIVSEVTISAKEPPDDAWKSDSIKDLKVIIVHAKGIKCSRCWNWTMDVGENVDHPALCARCVSSIS